MFEIVWSLVLDFIDFIGWYIPVLLVIGIIGQFIREAE